MCKARTARWFTCSPSPSPAPSSTSCGLNELLLQLGWAFPPQPQVSCEMHPCQLLPCTALLFCGQSGEVFAPEQPASCLASFLAQQTHLPIACSPPGLSCLLPRVREGAVALSEIWYKTLQTVKTSSPHSFKCCHLKAIPSKLLFLLLHGLVSCRHPG